MLRQIGVSWPRFAALKIAPVWDESSGQKKRKERRNYGDEIGGAIGLATIFEAPEAICSPILTRQQIYWGNNAVGSQ